MINNPLVLIKIPNNLKLKNPATNGGGFFATNYVYVSWGVWTILFHSTLFPSSDFFKFSVKEIYPFCNTDSNASSVNAD